MNGQQSPFLRLPPELRLMIYEKLCKYHYMPAVDNLSHVLINILVVTRHHALQASSDCLSNVHPSALPDQSAWPLNIKHVSTSFTCSILATCRLIHTEARHLPSLLPTRFLIEHDCLLLEKALFLERILSKSPDYTAKWSNKINWYKMDRGYNLDASSTETFIARASAAIFRPAATPPPEVVVFINNFKRTPGTDLPEDPYQFTGFIAIMRDVFSRRTGDLTIMWRPKPDADEVLSCGYRNDAWFDGRKSESPESPKRVTRGQWVEEWGED
jgi:hypothetical protein